MTYTLDQATGLAVPSLTREQEERLQALTLAVTKPSSKDGDSPRWIVATAETFRKYIATGELQG